MALIFSTIRTYSFIIESLYAIALSLVGQHDINEHSRKHRQKILLILIIMNCPDCLWFVKNHAEFQSYILGQKV